MEPRRFKKANRWVIIMLNVLRDPPSPQKKTEPVWCPFFYEGFSSTQVTLADGEAFDNPAMFWAIHSSDGIAKTPKSTMFRVSQEKLLP